MDSSFLLFKAHQITHLLATRGGKIRCTFKIEIRVHRFESKVTDSQVVQ